jgi:hypothetical protein
MSGKHSTPSRFFALMSLGVALSGCASSPVDESTFFVDPARYAMYDCKQLAGVRLGAASRIEELRGLMAKAETGAAGSVVSEVAYRPDYVSAQGTLKAANAAWERNRCDQSTEPSLARPPQGREPSAGRSKSSVY